MKVSCPTCDSQYNIADDKVVGRKVKVRCKSCGGQILVDGTTPAPDESKNTTQEDDDDATRVFTSEERKAFDIEHADVTTAPAETPHVTTPDAQKTELIWSVNVSETDERSLTTEQLVTAYLAGELDGEVFVWHDGLADWALIPDTLELKAPLAAAKAKAGSKPTDSKPKTESPEAATAKPTGALAATTQVLPKKPLSTLGSGFVAPKVAKEPLTEKKTAARASMAKRPQSAHDIFAAAADQTGQDVDLTVPREEEQKKTGARNESSVLFSLDALKAGIVSTPATSPQNKGGPGRKGPPVAPRKKLEDIMSEAAAKPIVAPAVTGPLMLSSNQALLTAPAPPPPKPEPKPVVVAEPQPTLNTSTPTATPTKVEPQKKKRTALIAGAALAAVVTCIGIAIAVSGGNNKDVQTAASTSPSLSAAVAVASSPEPLKPVATAPATTEEKTPEAVASTSAEPTKPEAPVAVANAGKNGVSSSTSSANAGAKKEETKKDTVKKEEKKADAAPAAPAAAGAFNVGAAKQALAVAASQATICKKPDGPTGTGKATVTFAPSGRATTAVISGGSFGGTTVGGCISNVFKRAKVPPFEGAPVTVSKSFTITL
jgi:predicted Zn finger-like uncharacterized protein